MLADGLRASDGTGSSKKYYLYDGGNAICRLDSTGTLDRTYVFAPDGLVGWSIPNSTSHQMLFDWQGNLEHSTGTTGDVATSHAYNAWGQRNSVFPINAVTGANDRYGYNARWGYVRDTTGLYYCQNRYYDPANGGWLNRDPIGYAGGMNLYGYCGGRPVGAADPTGLYKTGSYLGDVGEVFKGYGDALNPFNWARSAGALWAEGEMNGAGAAASMFGRGVLDTLQFWNAEDPRDFGNRFGGTLLLSAPLMKRIPSIGRCAAPAADVATMSPKLVPFPDPLNVPPDYVLLPGGRHSRGINGDTLSPDPLHGPPKGPHWDWWPPGEKPSPNSPLKEALFPGDEGWPPMGP